MRRMYLSAGEYTPLSKTMALFAIVFMGLAFADVPHLISYQGRLTDGTGTPLTGNHNITFNIYDSELSAIAIWTETQIAVPLNSEGLYNVMLGDVTPFPSSVDFSQQYWLGVEVDGGGEICRYELGASPYALNLSSLGASDGQVLKWNALASKWEPGDESGVGGSGTDNYISRWNGTNSLENSLIYQTDGGNIGIGTTSPVDELELVGDMRITNSSGNYIKISNFGTTQSVINAKSDSRLEFWTGSGGGASNSMTITCDHNVGIGTTSPEAKLHVLGNESILAEDSPTTGKIAVYADSNNVYITSYRMDDFHINMGNFGLGNAKLTVNSVGNVGIGTTSPTHKLEVDGDIYATGAITSGEEQIYIIDACEFAPNLNTSTYYIGNGYISGEGWFFAPIHIPDGATVDSAKVYFMDNAPGEDLSMNIWQYSHDASVGPATMMTFSYSGDDTYVRTSTSTDAFAVNLTTYKYEFSVFFSSYLMFLSFYTAVIYWHK